MTVLSMLITLFQSALTFFFNLEIQSGVYVGWIFVVVIVMFLLIRFFLKGSDNG